MTVLLNDEQESNEARQGMNDRIMARQINMVLFEEGQSAVRLPCTIQQHYTQYCGQTGPCGLEMDREVEPVLARSSK